MKWITVVQAISAVLAAVARLLKALKAVFTGSEAAVESSRVASLFD